MWQFALSVLTICMVVLSYGITNGWFSSCFSVFVLLVNSKSVCDWFFIQLNCFFISEVVSSFDQIVSRVFQTFYLVPQG